MEKERRPGDPVTKRVRYSSQSIRSQLANKKGPSQPRWWFSTRRPILFILQGTLIYAACVTFASTLIDYLVTQDISYLDQPYVLGRFRTSLVVGLVATFFIWLITKRVRNRR